MLSLFGCAFGRGCISFRRGCCGCIFVSYNLFCLYCGGGSLQLSAGRRVSARARNGDGGNRNGVGDYATQGFFADVV